MLLMRHLTLNPRRFFLLCCALWPALGLAADAILLESLQGKAAPGALMIGKALPGTAVRLDGQRLANAKEHRRYADEAERVSSVSCHPSPRAQTIAV